jgi:hypothetical protein
VDGQVHVGQPPGHRVGFLAEDGDVGLAAVVAFDELFGLNEHAAGAAAGIVDAAGIGLDHLDQHADDGARRVELAAQLTLGLGELAEKVFLHAAESIAGAAPLVLEPDACDQVDQRLHLLRRDAAAGIITRELVLEVRVVALDGDDGVVDQRGDFGPGGLVLDVRPARLGRDPEDALGEVLIAAFQERFLLFAGDAVLFQLGLELIAPGFERIRDVSIHLIAWSGSIVLWHQLPARQNHPGSSLFRTSHNAEKRSGKYFGFMLARYRTNT